MTNQEINKLATIATRYAQLQTAAKTADKIITEVKFNLFADIITNEELELLKKAQEVLEKISSNTHQTDAISYYKKILDAERVM